MSRPTFPHGMVQVAGVHDLDEARLVAEAGVDAVGAPLRLPVHAEDLTEAEAAAVGRALRLEYPDILYVCITYATIPREAVALARSIHANALQLHSPMSPQALATVRAEAPELLIIYSLVVGAAEEKDLLRAASAALPHVDAFLTDTYDPTTGATGATGMTHDWSVSRRLVTASPKPVVLAGGLTPGNVAEAIHAMRPPRPPLVLRPMEGAPAEPRFDVSGANSYGGLGGVDAHTGLEGSDGRKDPELLSDFVRAAREAFTTQRRRDG